MKPFISPLPFLGALFLLLFTSPLPADSDGAAAYLNKPVTWYRSKEAQTIATHILSYQSDLGGWPKNINTVKSAYQGVRNELKPTFDNGATTDELRFLAHCYQSHQEPIYQKAFQKGLDYIFLAQYPTGGWPQFYPPGTQYHRHITFNDGTMVRILEFLREVAADPLYGFTAATDRAKATAAFERGIDCILRCQIRINGQRTVWCAQHDEINFEPRPARAYELATLSGSESVGITRLLMSLQKPSKEVALAVDAAVAWFEHAAQRGIRVVSVDDAKAPGGKDRVLVHDPAAPALWARCYDLKTQQPLFCDRDGIPKTSYATIGYERRNGYSWYGNWPQKLIEQEYPQWKKTVRM